MKMKVLIIIFQYDNAKYKINTVLDVKFWNRKLQYK